MAIPPVSPFGLEVEGRMARAIGWALSAYPRPSLRCVYDQLRLELRREGLPVPSYGTFARRARRQIVQAAWSGAQAPASASLPGPAGTPKGGGGPYVIVDHALVGIMIVDEDGREIGRPLVTVTVHVSVDRGVPRLHLSRCEVSMPGGA